MIQLQIKYRALKIYGMLLKPLIFNPIVYKIDFLVSHAFHVATLTGGTLFDIEVYKAGGINRYVQKRVEEGWK